MALNADTPYGTGKWWLDKLEKTKFGLKSSKQTNHTIYRLGIARQIARRATQPFSHSHPLLGAR